MFHQIVENSEKLASVTFKLPSISHDCCKSCVLLATPIDHTMLCLSSSAHAHKLSMHVKVVSDYYGIAQPQGRYEISNIPNDFCVHHCTSLWVCPHSYSHCAEVKKLRDLQGPRDLYLKHYT